MHVIQLYVHVPRELRQRVHARLAGLADLRYQTFQVALKVCDALFDCTCTFFLTKKIHVTETQF